MDYERGQLTTGEHLITEAGRTWQFDQKIGAEALAGTDQQPESDYRTEEEQAFSANQLWNIVCTNPELFKKTIIPSLAEDKRLVRARELHDRNPVQFQINLGITINSVEHTSPQFRQHILVKLAPFQRQPHDLNSDEYEMLAAEQRQQITQDYAVKELVIDHIINDKEFINSSGKKNRTRGENIDAYYATLTNEYKQYQKLDRRYKRKMELGGGMDELMPWFEQIDLKDSDATISFKFFLEQDLDWQSKIIGLAYEKQVEDKSNTLENTALSLAQTKLDTIVGEADRDLEDELIVSSNVYKNEVEAARASKEQADSTAQAQYQEKLQVAETARKTTYQTELARIKDQTNKFVIGISGLAKWLQTEIGRDFMTGYLDGRKQTESLTFAAVSIAAASDEFLDWSADPANLIEQSAITEQPKQNDTSETSLLAGQISKWRKMSGRQTQTSHTSSEQMEMTAKIKDEVVRAYIYFAILKKEMPLMENFIRQHSINNPHIKFDFNTVVGLMDREDLLFSHSLVDSRTQDPHFMDVLRSYLKYPNQKERIHNIAESEEAKAEYSQLSREGVSVDWLKKHGFEGIDFTSLERSES
jgi:hypothetical protein